MPGPTFLRKDKHSNSADLGFSLRSNFVSSCFLSKIWAESALSLGYLSSPLVAEQVSPR